MPRMARRHFRCPADRRGRCSARGPRRGLFRRYSINQMVFDPSFAGSADAGDAAGKGDIMKTLVLGGLFAGWYAFNIYFNM